MYTCLSGFVDICEPVEEAFKREAFEEAGAILPGKTSAGLEAMHRKRMETDNITLYSEYQTVLPKIRNLVRCIYMHYLKICKGALAQVLS
jgi:8-oxo-dGTP pyrophosphatase MutT (NUDIX family)